MKNFFLFFLFVLSFSCNDRLEKNSACSVDFYYFFDRPVYDANSKLANSILFNFYELHFKNCSDTTPLLSKSIEIIVPETDSVFTLSNDSTHTFTYTFKNDRNKIVSEKIDDGEIEGVLLTKDLWQIRVKTKHFDFQKLVPTKERRYAYYERFKLQK